MTKRDFDFETGDGVGVKEFHLEQHAFMRVGEAVTQPGGDLAFVLHRIAAGKSVAEMIVPQSILEQGGFCVDKNGKKVFEFPNRETYGDFTTQARRRGSGGRLQNLLNRFNPKRFVARVKSML